MCQLYQVQSHDLPYEAWVQIQYNMGYKLYENYGKIMIRYSRVTCINYLLNIFLFILFIYC